MFVIMVVVIVMLEGAAFWRVKGARRWRWCGEDLYLSEVWCGRY